MNSKKDVLTAKSILLGNAKTAQEVSAILAGFDTELVTMPVNYQQIIKAVKTGLLKKEKAFEQIADSTFDLLDFANSYTNDTFNQRYGELVGFLIEDNEKKEVSQEWFNRLYACQTLSALEYVYVEYTSWRAVSEIRRGFDVLCFYCRLNTCCDCENEVIQKIASDDKLDWYHKLDKILTVRGLNNE
jgi:hypothetical protein